MTMTGQRLSRYLLAVGIVAAAAALAALVAAHVAPVNLAMIFLLAVVAAAFSLGRGPSALSAVLAVAVFDFFFVPPHLTFVVDDLQYLLTFAAMLLVGLTISTLTARLREQAAGASAREQRATALYGLSRDLADADFEGALLHAAVRHTGQLFAGDVVVLLPGERRALEPKAGNAAAFAADDREEEVIEWVRDHGRPAGLGTGEFHTADALYVPLPGAQGDVLGVLGVRWAKGLPALPEDPVRLLQTFGNQIALALGRLRQTSGHRG